MVRNAEILAKLIDEDFLKNQSITSLASKYNVSEEVIWWRLMDCKLINKM